MHSYDEQVKALALRLFEINAFKFGEFKMKVGINSPVYFDLRVIVSYPDVMDQVAQMLWDFAREKSKCQHLCGVPYTALPVATLISVNSKIPMLIRRKEAKSYGTKKLIEGKFKAGDTCLIIEDIVTSGASILETVKDLESEGLKVTDAIVVVDREQGGAENINNHGIKMHSLFTLTQLLKILKEAGKIQQDTLDSVQKYLKAVQIKPDGSFKDDETVDRTKLSYEERAKITKNEVAKKLFSIMATKQTNLCVALDLTKSIEILDVLEQVAPHICILKLHCDIIIDFNDNLIKNIAKLAEKHNFMIMEDRKFSDIGNTVMLQYTAGLHRIGSWADLVTVHGISGPGVIDSLRAGMKANAWENKGLFLLAEMSSKDNLLTPSYTESILKQTFQNLDLVVGLVCQNKNIVKEPGLIQFTPGVQLNQGVDSMDQVYNTPNKVVKTNGADIAVVGRGITESKNPENTARIYRDQLWQAYLDRLH